MTPSGRGIVRRIVASRRSLIATSVSVLKNAARPGSVEPSVKSGSCRPASVLADGRRLYDSHPSLELPPPSAGGFSDMRTAAGTWRDLTESVNSMASNLTNQVRNIAEVTTAVANGDLSKKLNYDVTYTSGEHMLTLLNRLYAAPRGSSTAPPTGAARACGPG